MTYRLREVRSHLDYMRLSRSEDRNWAIRFLAIVVQIRVMCSTIIMESKRISQRLKTYFLVCFSEDWEGIVGYIVFNRGRK